MQIPILEQFIAQNETSCIFSWQSSISTCLICMERHTHIYIYISCTGLRPNQRGCSSVEWATCTLRTTSDFLRLWSVRWACTRPRAEARPSSCRSRRDGSRPEFALRYCLTLLSNKSAARCKAPCARLCLLPQPCTHRVVVQQLTITRAHHGLESVRLGV